MLMTIFTVQAKNIYVYISCATAMLGIWYLFRSVLVRPMLTVYSEKATLCCGDILSDSLMHQCSLTEFHISPDGTLNISSASPLYVDQ